ncbi:glucans biosynthesis protein [Roseovarius tolerans]|uniref:Glucans biosynthesis protein n=1 Tax=Roseovarius tolerans TaxID=74031 RepID=A0A1H8H5S9_9RHOB|nr:glucan biosynthesis protein G [Roseovarius tolerans]SEN51485.1 glucans biosynthesis protein [Roseovarius tolerans]
MIRRDVLKSLSAFALLPRLASAQAAQPFSEAMLLDLAREVAAKPYAKRPTVPQAWQDMSYDEYRSIWFRSKDAIWSEADSTLELDLFLPGLYFPHTVEVNLVEDGMTRTLPFDFSLFDKTDKAPDLPLDGHLGYSGLRLRAELEKPGIFQEYAVFQGASYFRVIARDLVYGLSARGLAVDTGGPEGEEFPDFTRFWIEKPAPGVSTHTVHALMESPSVTGIYHFTMRPEGAETEVEVRCTLLPRVALENVGIAPLTSMFYFDATNRHRFDDFRAAVHDSDGLSILNGNGEMLWRPLGNPRDLQISSFVDSNPQGFGLSQRSRAYSDFHDLEAHYHERPSLWITPGEGWGRGAVTLVEIPTDKEIYDNIVAYWRPREPLAEGAEHSFSYGMTWTGGIEEKKPVARVIETRVGRGFPNDMRQVVTVDFAPHDALPEAYDDLVLYVYSNRLETSEGQVQRNPETGGPRLAFSFDPGEVTAAEIRAQLFHEGRGVSEVWLYRWTA